MLQLDYLNTIRTLIDSIEVEQAPQTDGAAEAIVNALVAGNDLYISGLGHGNDGDLLNRAGGLVVPQPFSFSFSCRDRSGGIDRERPRKQPWDTGLETARLAVRASHMRTGDCLIAGSVSGRSIAPVSLAVAAREIGVTVIGITSLAYSSRIEPIHSTGNRLSDVSDIVIDNCAPYGDAALDVEGMPEKVVPVSGVGTILVCWMIQSQIIEKLLGRGLQPSCYMSGNRPGGSEFNKKVREQFNRQGY